MAGDALSPTCSNRWRNCAMAKMACWEEGEALDPFCQVIEYRLHHIRLSPWKVKGEHSLSNKLSATHTLVNEAAISHLRLIEMPWKNTLMILDRESSAKGRYRRAAPPLGRQRA